MELKYKNEIEKLSCELDSFSEKQNRIAYRWVIDDLDHPNNFLPRALIINQVRGCGSWSLSFFETQGQAVNRLKHIANGKINLLKKLGNHVAEGTLIATDGISATCDEQGHFEHYEYEGIELKTKFKIVCKVS